MDMMSLLIQCLSGAVGGNVAGLLNRARSLGPLINTILGAIGGVGGGQLLGDNFGAMLGGGNVGMAASSGILGVALPLLASFLRKKPA